MSKYKLVIFDFDGTLFDTSEGIFHSVRHAEKSMGLKPVSDEELRLFVGPPPKEMYKKLYGLNDEKAFQAAGFHREYGREKAIFEAKVYDGIPELLQQLRNNGIITAIATLKAETIAKRILELNKMCNLFDIVLGMDKNESLTKSGLIQNVVSKSGVEKENAVLIGDTEYDAIGAEQAGVSFLGVTYGFGFASEEDVSKYNNIGACGSVFNIFSALL